MLYYTIPTNLPTCPPTHPPTYPPILCLGLNFATTSLQPRPSPSQHKPAAQRAPASLPAHTPAAHMPAVFLLHTHTHTPHLSLPGQGWTGPSCAGLVMLGKRGVEATRATKGTSFVVDLRKWLELMDSYEVRVSCTQPAPCCIRTLA